MNDNSSLNFFTWNVISEPDGRESDEGEVKAVQVGPTVLDVPEGDRRNKHEDEEAGNDVAKDLEHQHDDLLHVVATFRIFSLKLGKLKSVEHRNEIKKIIIMEYELR